MVAIILVYFLNSQDELFGLQNVRKYYKNVKLSFLKRNVTSLNVKR